MPSNPGPLPSFIPSFAMDPQSGNLEANPEGSVAAAKMERLLPNRDQAKATFLSERNLQAKRQGVLDRYYSGAEKGDLAPMGENNRLRELPMITSPQPVHVFKENSLQQDVVNNRVLQQHEFGKSFMAFESGLIHEEVDEALKISDSRKKEILSGRKGPGIKDLFKSSINEDGAAKFSKKEKEYIFAPLEEAISFLNGYYVEKKIPVQIKWREVWRSEGHPTKELFMIFPSIRDQLNRPSSSWAGMNEVI